MKARIMHILLSILLAMILIDCERNETASQATMEMKATENQSPMPKVYSGRIERIENMPSKYCEPRTVDIWLPEGYDGSKKYAVLYMHDGQMLYDASITWNKQAWEIDSVATELMKKGLNKDFIVVGVWNAGEQRHPNYFPKKPFEQLSAEEKQWVNEQLQNANRVENGFSPNSDAYLKFLVEELKPRIDSSYAVYTDLEHTFIAGSSMGGLISWYAMCEYPQVFGGAACISTHWPGVFDVENNPIPRQFIRYLQANLPRDGKHKIYFDTGDQTLDAMYPAIQKEVDAIMQDLGYNESNWLTRYFPGADHSEISWQKRLDVPITFLLNK